MKTYYLKTRCLVAVSLAILVFQVALTAQDKRPASGTANLAYDLPSGKPMAYSINSVITQQMEAEGQSITVYVNNKLAFNAKQTAKQEGNLVLEIVVDTLSISVDAMGNSTGGNISEVAGKSFNMTISPSGKVVDVTGAEKLLYSVEGQGSGNMDQTFRDIFPQLPGRQVRIGEEWTEKDTVTSQNAGARVFQVIESVNRYEGNETINGIPCAKITSTVKGTMETTTQNSGMDLYLHGPLTGQVAVYFALNGGYVVRQDVRTRLNGTMDISGPATMSMPMVMDTSTRMILK